MAESSRKLTVRQARFVKLFVENGGFAAPAARDAGYTPKSARFGSHKFLDIPHVLAAIRLEVQRKLDASVALAARVLETLAKDAKSEAVRLQAASALLDRGGLRLAQYVQHDHTHVLRDERSDAELRARVIELQRELGIRTHEVIRPALPARLADDVIDVTPVQVERTQVEREADRDDAAPVEPKPAKPADDIFFVRLRLCTAVTLIVRRRSRQPFRNQ